VKPLGLLLFVAALAGCAVTRYFEPEEFAAVTPGMTQAEVRERFGEPARVEAFARMREVAWDYPVHDPWGYPAFQSLIFDERGRVARKQYIRIELDDQ
jgi:outer membrane protein assembly factor BamE (lipoprotein component of BamABCDE complex)